MVEINYGPTCQTTGSIKIEYAEDLIKSAELRASQLLEESVIIRQAEQEANQIAKGLIQKNIDDFCKLNLPDIKIAIGDGPQLQELKKKYPTVSFIGKLKPEELVEYYQNADVFVLPAVPVVSCVSVTPALVVTAVSTITSPTITLSLP